MESFLEEMTLKVASSRMYTSWTGGNGGECSVGRHGHQAAV